MTMIRIGIIVAMEREVAPLVRRWKVRTIEHTGRRYRLFENAFENGEAILVCGGIGAEAARRATEALIREVSPRRVISAGFAGALNASLQVGQVLEPRTVINVADGARTDVGAGEGILVSSATVAGKEQKAWFSKTYGASAVDMEAAAVAEGAQARGVEFAALKVISDDADFEMPAMDRFVGEDSSFRSSSFVCYVAMRPWLWRTTIAMARNSSKASQALCGALKSYLGRALCGASFADELNRTKVSSEFAGAQTGTGSQAHTQADRKL